MRCQPRQSVPLLERRDKSDVHMKMLQLGQGSGDLRRALLEYWQDALHEVLTRNSSSRDADAQCRENDARGRLDRNGERQQPELQLLIDDGEAILASLRYDGMELPLVVDRMAGQLRQAYLLDRVLEPVVRKTSQENSPERRHMRRQARADAQICGDDAPRDNAGDVDDLGPAEDGDVARFLSRARGLFQDRLRYLPPRLAREIGVAQLENAGAEPEGLLVGPDVSELGKGEQEPARCRTREAGFGCSFSQRKGGLLGPKC